MIGDRPAGWIELSAEKTESAAAISSRSVSIIFPSGNCGVITYFTAAAARPATVLLRSVLAVVAMARVVVVLVVMVAVWSVPHYYNG